MSFSSSFTYLCLSTTASCRLDVVIVSELSDPSEPCDMVSKTSPESSEYNGPNRGVLLGLESCSVCKLFRLTVYVARAKAAIAAIAAPRTIEVIFQGEKLISDFTGPMIFDGSKEIKKLFVCCKSSMNDVKLFINPYNTVEENENVSGGETEKTFPFISNSTRRSGFA